jgi:hypothetical protein
MKTPELVPLFNIDIELEPPILAPTPIGMRVTSVARGGKFVGDRLSGTIVAGGGDWAVIDGQGVFRIDARVSLQIADGPVVHMFYSGRLSMPEGSMERLAGGEMLDPDTIYFRTTPVFEVEPGPFAWLNSVQAVGTGNLGPGLATYQVYELT